MPDRTGLTEPALYPDLLILNLLLGTDEWLA